MRTNERRKEIIKLLMSAQDPLSGTALAMELNVSRQIIVQDISVLKASGYDILSTHHGYVIQEMPYVERVFKLKHTKEQTEDELNTIVDFGGVVANVFVWHKVYGKISAKLNIFSRLQVKQFMEGVRTGESTELMNITGGYHYHTVRAENEDVLDKIAKVLDEKNYLIHGED